MEDEGLKRVGGMKGGGIQVIFISKVKSTGSGGQSDLDKKVAFRSLHSESVTWDGALKSTF